MLKQQGLTQYSTVIKTLLLSFASGGSQYKPQTICVI